MPRRRLVRWQEDAVRSFIVAAVVLVSLGVGACQTDPAPAGCVTGTQIRCGCAGAADGTQVCRADGTYGACVCGPPGDAAVDVPTVDAPTVDAPTVDAPTVDAPTVDAPTVDAPTVDAPTVDVPTVDIAGDVPPPDAGADAGLVVVDDGLHQEQRHPWRSSACALWEQVPPQCFYRSMVEDDGGLWAVCDDGFVMRRGAAGWTRTQLRSDSGRLTSVATGPGWVAAVGYAVSGFVHLRRSGAWSEVALPAGLRQPSVALGVGSDLVVAGFSGEIYRYDGAAWTALWDVVGSGQPVQLWGSRSDLYEAFERGVRHYDGAAWTDLTLPAPGTFLGVAGASAAEVFAITGTALYRVDGAALRADPAPAGCASPTYLSLSASGSTLLLAGRCAGVPTAWRRAGAGWTALPALPTATEFRATVTPSGAVYAVSAASAAPVYQLVDGAWRSLTEVPAPQGQVIAGRAATDLYTGGSGVSHLDADDVWRAVPGSEGLAVRALWQAPEGTLFAATAASGTVTLRRRDATGWRVDHAAAAVTTSNLVGRSASDVYVALDNTVMRWNGSAWTSLGVPACPYRTHVSRLYLAGQRLVYANCTGYTVEGWLQYDGASWTTAAVTGGYPAQSGPTATPSLVLIGAGTGTIMVSARNDDGWSASYLPALGSTGPWVAADPRTLVGGTFRRTRPAGASSLSDWTTARLTGRDLNLWSDGRVVVGAAVSASSDAVDLRSGRIVRCDFGR